MKKLIAYVGALLLALGVTLVVAAPAQAYGWVAGNCQTQAGNGAKVCLSLHTAPFQNGQRVDQLLVCATKVDNTYGNRFRGIKNTGITYFGGNGSMIGGDSIVEPDGASYAGTCAYTTPANPDKLGLSACYKVEGTLDLSLYPDADFTVKGKVSGGAYDC